MLRHPKLCVCRTSSWRAVKRHSHNVSLIKSRPVENAPSFLLEDSNAFLAYALSPAPQPLRFCESVDPGPSRAAALLRSLRSAEDRVIEVEVGRYNDISGVFEQVAMHLGQYLDWLESDSSNGGKIGGRQVYLAQWHGSDDIPALADLIQPPTLLKPLLTETPFRADLYQTSFFIGPAGAVTPLHHDPYFNLYQVYASSQPHVHAKHIFLLPPNASELLKRVDGLHTLRNTSPIELSLSTAQDDQEFLIWAEPGVSERSVEAMSTHGMSCTLRESEMLFIPKGWWHRVENVTLRESDRKPSSHGWTAGIGWWWLPHSP